MATWVVGWVVGWVFEFRDQLKLELINFRSESTWSKAYIYEVSTFWDNVRTMFYHVKLTFGLYLLSDELEL